MNLNFFQFYVGLESANTRSQSFVRQYLDNRIAQVFPAVQLGLVMFFIVEFLNISNRLFGLVTHSALVVYGLTGCYTEQ